MQQRNARHRRWLLSALCGALVVSSGACEDDTDINVVATRSLLAVRFISVRSGDGQVGVVRQPLARPVVVHVSDENGASIVMAAVHWKVLRGGGSVFVSDSLTDDIGNASAMWTMGPKTGVDSLSASIANGAFVIFTATATQP